MNHPYRVLPEIDGLPHALYTAGQVREMDNLAINSFGISGEALMERAGVFSYRKLRELWPKVRDITLLCGTGNNGGDGFVIARLAQQDGLQVRILQLGNPHQMQGAAEMNAERAYDLGIEIEIFQRLPQKTDLIVDALLGTGLDRPASGHWAEAIESVNRHPAPVLAIDVPSGFDVDTGRPLGKAIVADATVTFIGLKQGQFTGQGPDYCGRLFFDSLGVPARLYATTILNARRIDWSKQQQLMPARKPSTHKGDCGHVLVIGGATGYSGAVRLAGEAALRCGAGLVTIATRPGHAAVINIGCPELMCQGIETARELAPLLEACSVVAIGPGLGQTKWAQNLLEAVSASGKPVVMDADALNLLAEKPEAADNRIITPHPGEASRLLGCSTGEIQQDRFSAARKLQARYGGTVVLKGTGTLVESGGDRPVALCSGGNPGMATAGMGDVLTGVIAGLLAQGLDADAAAETGVALHAAAADEAAADGMRGMIAGDLYPQIRKLLG